MKHVAAAVNACPFKASITVAISGTARGADKFGEAVAAAEGWGIERHPADWDRHGRRAGYLRNAHMASLAEALVAVWDGESRGTKHMIDLSERAGLRVFVHRFVPETIPAPPHRTGL